MDFRQIYRLFLFTEIKIYLLKNKSKINLINFRRLAQNQIPKIAITVSSFIISKDPLAIKYNDVSTSPL